MLQTVSTGAVAILVVLGPVWLTTLPAERAEWAVVRDVSDCMAVPTGVSPEMVRMKCFQNLAEAREGDAGRFAAFAVLSVTLILAAGTGFQTWQVILLSQRDEREAKEEHLRATREAIAEASALARQVAENTQGTGAYRPTAHDVLAWVADEKRTARGRRRRRLTRAQRAIARHVEGGC